MGKWKHVMIRINKTKMIGTCKECGRVKLKKKGDRYLCSVAQNRWKNNGKKGSYRDHKTNTCEECGFTSKHPCQLDVDHIDGNKKNSSPDNLRTLCANCHRLVTWRANHYGNRYDS